MTFALMALVVCSFSTGMICGSYLRDRENGWKLYGLLFALAMTASIMTAALSMLEIEKTKAKIEQTKEMIRRATETK